MSFSRQLRKLRWLPRCLHVSAVLIKAMVCEIFDESAYMRFLSRHQVRASRGSYAAFLEEHERLQARRPRCC
jgi:hypothetical protein